MSEDYIPLAVAKMTAKLLGRVFFDQKDVENVACPNCHAPVGFLCKWDVEPLPWVHTERHRLFLDGYDFND